MGPVASVAKASTLPKIMPCSALAPVSNGPIGIAQELAWRPTKLSERRTTSSVASHSTRLHIKMKVSVLQNEVSRLSALVSNLQSKSTSTIPDTEPTPSGSYSSAVITGECGVTLHRQPFPSMASSYESPRMFNVVVFGIEECSQGAKRHERLASDISKIKSVLVDIDGSLKSCSIKDFYRLGRYKADQVKPRPILVKFVRIEDVSKVLANRWVAKSPILVKPDMTKEERVRESICSGVLK